MVPGKNLMDIFRLDGETAVITGGYSPLGLFMAAGLLEAGARVVLSGRDAARCREEALKLSARYRHNAIHSVSLDVCCAASLKQGFAEIKKITGDFNILINNAASVVPGSLMSTGGDDFSNGLETTVGGVFRCTQAAAEYLRTSPQENKAIVNIASMYGMVSPDPRLYGDNPGAGSPPQYGAGKAAIIQFTRYSAVQMAEYGIRVNALSPGAFPRPEAQKNKEFIKRLAEKIPMGRIGQGEELKGAVVFLVSRASSYVTGHNLVVDGGWTAW